MKKFLLFVLAAFVLGSAVSAQNALGVKIKIQPTNAVPTQFLVDRQVVPVNAWPFEYTFPVGGHEFILKANGFQDIVGNIAVSRLGSAYQGHIVLQTKQTYDLESRPNQATPVLPLTFIANAEPAVTSVTLRVDANVKGATVFINNNQVGTAGQTFTLKPATYNVRVSAAGYQDFVTTVQLKANQTLSAVLQAASANLTVQSNVKGAQVSINGTLAGTAGSTFTLAQGTYQVQVSAPGYTPFVTTVQVNGDQVINAVLASANFNLQVLSNVKSAQVLVNGNAVGSAGQSFSLPPGTYQIQVSAPGFQTFLTTFKLAKDDVLNAVLQAASANLTVQSNVKGAQILLNGSTIGTAGSTFSLTVGTYQIQVSAPGYQDFISTVTLNNDQTINAVLQPAMYQITVQSNVKGAQVYFNGTLAGNVGSTFSLQSGIYDVKVSAPGYQDTTNRITLQSNQSVTLNLQQVLGTIVFSIPKDVELKIFIDNNKLNPNQLIVSLQPGQHLIRFEDNSGLVAEVTVTVSPGQTLTLTPVLTILIK